jgi:20S proteasome alpha/beta subunit
VSTNRPHRKAPYLSSFCDTPGQEREDKDTDMTLIIALLRKDYIVFACDGRHVKGTPDARYKDDYSSKAHQILGNTGMLGFSGSDEGEEVIRTLKRSGRLETGSLSDVAKEVRKAIEDIYEDNISRNFPPESCFLLAGFEDSVATTITICPPHFKSLSRTYDPDLRFDNFEIIGTRLHGALYAFRKCTKKVRDQETEIRLACFALTEVQNYEIRVGGREHVCIIHPDKKVEDISDKLTDYIKWSEEAGEKIREIMLGE